MSSQLRIPYYDIVLVGKTGQGKSSLGNKLVDLENTHESKIQLFPSFQSSNDKKKRFTQADDPEVTPSGKMLSVTGRCKIMSNENTKIRVLDVPGFSDSGALQRGTGLNVSVFDGNLQVIRWMVREQIQSQLKVRCIVYFLPVRGSPEKADGTMQEELKVLNHYFGKEVFKYMVVVATHSPKEKYQAISFDNDDYKQSKEAFDCALKMAIHDKDIACPPIIYIGLHDSSDIALRKIQSAIVLRESFLDLKITKEVCARCSFKILTTKENHERVCVVDTDGKTIPYAMSKCHPSFKPKYSTFEKVAGGAVHMATLGFGLLVEHFTGVDTWPGFTNSDEICVFCDKSPGSKGCVPVGNKITIVKNREKETIKVDHSNEL